MTEFILQLAGRIRDITRMDGVSGGEHSGSVQKVLRRPSCLQESSPVSRHRLAHDDQRAALLHRISSTKMTGTDREPEDGGNLPTEVENVARKELREDPNTRKQALRLMREWLAKNRDISNCRTDSNFLLRFLRVKKFSVPMAQQTLLKYLNFRQTFSHLLMRLDPLDPVVEGLIRSGYIFVSPYRDALGRRVVIYITRMLDPQVHTAAHMCQAHMLTYETLLEEDKNQVMGVCHVADLRQLPLSTVTLWDPNEFSTIVKWGEQSVPMRHKEIHFLNVPTPLRYVYDFACSRISEKMKNRFVLHNSLDQLHNRIDTCVLPKEYGGTMPMTEMIELWLGEVTAKRERLLGLDNIQLLSTDGIISRKKKYPQDHKSNITSLTGSFRKLEVD
ncbi:retinaldehyde-binding protein 1 [Anabrus simplex]|uniref:retinaldehyde-binding protein 1 n=1 Tax=Anabrus simplex TaxID=316456 RepID=UPI0035A36EE5